MVDKLPLSVYSRLHVLPSIATPFDLVPPSFIIVGVCLQPQSSRFVICSTVRHDASKMTKTSHISQSSLQFAASSRHWILYEGVLALDMTIFVGWHCEYDRLWYIPLWAKILKQKMTISRDLERSRTHLNMFWDHKNIIEKDGSVCFEWGGLFLLQTLDLFVRRTINAKCNKSSYLGNQSSNDKARTHPKLAMT